MTGLRERWNDLIPEADPLAADLAGRYAAGDRRAYRDQYVATVLTALDSLEQLSTDPTAVRLAAWFHRAVHEAGAEAAQDAEASARLAEETLPAYGVSAARTAEVARLVRLTGQDPTATGPDPNGEVLLDAVNAVLASERYAVHSSEVRRDGAAAADSRHAAVKALLDGELYRTQLGRNRWDDAARANLTSELEVLNSQLPAPWRGWQHSALVTTATSSALVAAAVAFAATLSNWRIPAFGPDYLWLAMVFGVLALCAVPLLYRFSRREGRLARLVPGGVAAVGMLGVVLVWMLAPDTNPLSGVGLRVPLLMTASILLVIAGAAALGASFLTTRPNTFNRGQLLARVAVPAIIVLAVLVVAQPLWRNYVLTSNERLDGPRTPVDASVRSDLTGEVSWILELRGYTLDALRNAVSTRHGIATARRTGTIEMLDPATGQLRWRYERSDSTGLPDLFATGDGELLLASFDDVGHLLLDADTGERKAAWPIGSRDDDIEYADPLLTGEEVGKGSDKLRGVNPDGKDRWTFEPGRCTGISAVATADTAVAFLSRGCGDADEMTGLDLKTGKKLWSRAAHWAETPVVAGGLVVGRETDGRSPAESRGTLVGFDARTGEEKWRWQLPSAWSCRTKVEVAGDRVVLIDCPTAAAEKTQTVVTAIDAGRGSVDWQRIVPIELPSRVAVTADARVLSVQQTPDGCRLDIVEEAGYHQAELAPPIRCRQGVRALGNLVLAGGQNLVIALR